MRTINNIDNNEYKIPIIKSVPNLRDIGGYKTVEGFTIAKNLLYRSNQLYNIKKSDMEKLIKLKLKYVYDLRTMEERKQRPDELPPHVNYIPVDILSDISTITPVHLEKLLKDPVNANMELGDGKAEKLLCMAYRKLVVSESAMRGFRKIFISLANNKKLPALIHCTTGKDRTGIIIALFLSLLGVEWKVIINDYLESNNYIIPLYKELINDFINKGGQKDIPFAIIGVKKEYIIEAFDEIIKKYGSISQYLNLGLGIENNTLLILKKIFLMKP